MREFRLAFKTFWMVLSLLTIAILIAPWVMSAERIASLTPLCERKASSGRECFCCGMTTAFIEIAHGRWSGAAHSNRGSVPLYAGFLCNGLVFLGEALVTLRRGGKP